MLLTLSTSHHPATDLGYLLHKHPGKAQSFDLPFGKVHVFYPRVEAETCTAAILLDIDPVALVRGRREPLRRVHECAFAVLAMESEPVDPRL